MHHMFCTLKTVLYTFIIYLFGSFLEYTFQKLKWQETYILCMTRSTIIDMFAP